jgi:hypothetical protein
MFYEVHEGYVILRIKAVPGSSISKIADIMDNTLRIKIAAPAVEGAANKELVKFLSKLLKVSKSDIEFLSGETSKVKRVKVACTDPEAIVARLSL